MKLEYTRRSFNVMAGLIIGIGAATAIERAQAADSCDDLYKGANVTLMTSFNPGGGGDQTTRLIAQMLEKHLPGVASVQVENHQGGAHGVGANYFAQNAKPDGKTLFYTNAVVLQTYISGGAAIKFDPRKFTPLGGFNLGNYVVVVRPQVKDNIYDPKADPVIVGDTNGVRNHVAMTLIAADYLGYNFKWNYGYKGGNDLTLAMERGEIDVYGSINRTALKDLIDTGTAVPLFQYGSERSADYPDTPTLQELLDEKGVTLSPEDAAAYGQWLAAEPAQHLFFAPEGTPDNMANCLRDTFVTITEDPEFDKRMGAVLSKVWKRVTPQVVMNVVDKATTVSDAVDARLKEIRKEHGLPVD